MRYEASKAIAFVAIASSRRGDLDRAGAMFDEAASGFDAEGNLAWRSLVDLYRAIVLLEARRPAEARREAVRARDWFAGAGHIPRTVLSELLLARAEPAMGALPEARRQVESARRRLEDLDSPHLQYHASFVDGQIAEAGGDRAAAVKRYAAACTILGALRSRLRGKELLIAFVRDKQVVYESLIWLLLEGGDPDRGEEAFGWVESAKSRVFADLIAPRPGATGGARSRSGGLDRRIRRLREELNWCYSQLDAADLAAVPAGMEGDALLERRGHHAAGELRRRSRRLEEKLTRAMSRARSRDPCSARSTAARASRSTTSAPRCRPTRCCSSTTKRAEPCTRS